MPKAPILSKSQEKKGTHMQSGQKKVYHGTLINSEENILMDYFVQGSSHDRVGMILVSFFSITMI
jgi:hypothetical protein